MRVAHPTTRHLEKTMRPNFVKVIAVSFGLANEFTVKNPVATTRKLGSMFQSYKALGKTLSHHLPCAVGHDKAGV